jgi:dolichyl-phosphate-mannose-protein mannosyltransferase
LKKISIRIVLALLMCGLLLLPAGVAFAAGPSIENADFETIRGDEPVAWQPDAWLMDDATDFRIEDGGYNGGKCAAIDSFFENDARFIQTVNVEQNSNYRISCMVKTEGVGENNTGANISAIGTNAMSEPVVGDNDWQEIYFYGSTLSGQTEITIALRLGGYGRLNYGLARFDDVKIQKVSAVPNSESVQSLEEAKGSTQSGRADGGSVIFLTTAIFLCLAFMMLRKLSRRDALAPEQYDAGYAAVGIGIIAFAIRLLMAVSIDGFPNDMACWKSWVAGMAEFGPGGFYTSTTFCDYPPGYMYVLWGVGGMQNLFALTHDSIFMELLVKLPGIIADMVTAYMVFRLAKKNMPNYFALALMALVALNPAYFFLSAGWGQIDSILAMLILACFWLYKEKKRLLSFLVYALALLVKTQALMFGPVLLIAVIRDIYLSENKKPVIKEMLLGIVAAVALFIALELPFMGDQGFLWILDKYFGTMGSYPYASVNAFNLFSMLGQNWVDQSSRVLGLPFNVYGMAFIVAVIAFVALIYFKDGRQKDGQKVGQKSIFLCAAVLIFGIYMLAHTMHERYCFPAILLLIAAYIELKDKRLLYMAICLSATFFAGTAILLERQYLMGFDPWLIVLSAANMGILVWMSVTAYDIMVKGNICLIDEPEEGEKEREFHSDGLRESIIGRYAPDEGARLTRKDYIILAIITVIYAAAAFINLGTTKTPQTLYESFEQGDVAIIDLGESREIGSILFYPGITDKSFSAYISQDGEQWSDYAEYKIEYTDMYRWKETGLPSEARYVKISMDEEGVRLNEIVLADADRREIGIPEGGIILLDETAASLFDERGILPETPSYYNGMYFDELYHARTAFEHINGLKPYENTHPPLGKVFIAGGVLLFGMNPLGWRIVGALFGVLMVPAMYWLGRRLFKSTFAASAVCLIFTFDLMHFAQTRIATIDSYPVFFIMLMYYFMYKYTRMSFYRQPLKQTLRPLAMSGIMFGIGCATKWIAVYSGIGLAVLFFHSLYRRYVEHKYAVANLSPDDGDGAAAAINDFRKNTIKTVLWCGLFFVVIPVLIYIGSYFPYYLCAEKPYDFNGMLKLQEYMYNYHSALDATHPYQSAWYEWPLMIRPMYWFSGRYVPEGMISGITTMGNPIVWWTGCAAIIAMLVVMAKGRGKRDYNAFFITVGFLSQFVPWILVSRCVFIYHYFASVPFIVLATVYFMDRLIKSKPERKKYAIAFIILVIAAFIFFFPAVSGITISRSYSSLMGWLPSWVMF